MPQTGVPSPSTEECGLGNQGLDLETPTWKPTAGLGNPDLETAPRSTWKPRHRLGNPDGFFGNRGRRNLPGLAGLAEPAGHLRVLHRHTLGYIIAIP